MARLARRIASFPVGAVRSAKRVLNELSLPGADAIRGDARRFHQLVTITPAELAEVRYIHYDYWDELSGGSRLAVDAAARIRVGVAPFGAPNNRERLTLRRQ